MLTKRKKDVINMSNEDKIMTLLKKIRKAFFESRGSSGEKT